MKFNITENKKNKTITVEAAANENIEKKSSAKTQELEQYLKNNNFLFSRCIKEDYINNRHGKLNGEWIFSTQTAAIEKTVDNSPPSVVKLNNEAESIPQEESEAPKSASKRKRKKVTSKKEG